MISAVYVEEAVADHPRTLEILGRLPASVPRIHCKRYGEVFNRRGQNFRLQKRRPALVLAQKEGRRVLPTPEGYGIGGERNFYFSHMLNCVYDCRYCFLQGMYRSAHYVVFVNFEDFFDEAAELADQDPGESYFFSGYDADSLALEGLTGFAASALDVFRELPWSWLELRTKSARMAPLLATEPWERCVVAMSFTPRAVSEELEHKVPPIERRLAALESLAERGWPLGLRFDPLVWQPDFREQYQELFEDVFKRLPVESLHSVTFGPFRLPAGFFRTLERLYPEEPLVAGAFEERGGMVSYRRELEKEMVDFCRDALREYVPEERFFPCAVEPEGQNCIDSSMHVGVQPGNRPTRRDDRRDDHHRTTTNHRRTDRSRSLGQRTGPDRRRVGHRGHGGTDLGGTGRARRRPVDGGRRPLRPHDGPPAGRRVQAKPAPGSRAGEDRGRPLRHRAGPEGSPLRRRGLDHQPALPAPGQELPGLGPGGPRPARRPRPRRQGPAPGRLPHQPRDRRRRSDQHAARQPGCAAGGDED